MATTGAGAQSFVYSEGHGDIGVGYEDGSLVPHWHLHAGAVVNGSSLGADEEYAPGDVIGFVPNPSISRPAGAQWDFLGVAAGSPVWLLPQSNQAGKPFLGIASEELGAGEWSSLSLSLVALSGPAGGTFSLWQPDGFGAPDVKMASGDGISGADTFSFATVPGHDHYFYGFTKEGVYEVTLRWDGVHVTDGPVSATDTFAFGVTVVPEPGTMGLGAAVGLFGFAWLRRTLGRRSGGKTA